MFTTLILPKIGDKNHKNVRVALEPIYQPNKLSSKPALVYSSYIMIIYLNWKWMSERTLWVKL